MDSNIKSVFYIFAFTFVTFTYSTYAETGVPNWWTLNGSPKETTFSNINENEVNIKDVATALTILPTDVGENNIRAAITLFLDKDHGQVYYFLNAQHVTDNPTSLIPKTTEAMPLSLPMPTIDPSPSIPARYLSNPKVIHATVAAMDDIVVVTYGIQYDGPDNKKFVNLEYTYGQIHYPSVTCNQCDLYDMTIEWTKEYHSFKGSSPLPHKSASCGSTLFSQIYFDWKTSNVYPTLTAAITKAHHIVFSGTLYQTTYIKSGTIIKQKNGEISDNLTGITAKRISRSAESHKECFDEAGCWCTKPVGARSSDITLVINDSYYSARGIIVERKRSKGDNYNNLYWHGIRFNFADEKGNDHISDMTFAATEVNDGLLVSKRTVNYDKGIAPVIAFVESARTYNTYNESMIPLFEMHKASRSNKLYGNIGGMLAVDAGDNKPYTFTIANTDKKHSMSEAYQDGKYDIDGFEYKSIAAQEYDTFPSLSATPYGDILMARTCGKSQAHICTQWARAMAAIGVNVPMHLIIKTLSSDSIQLNWEPSKSYGIDTYIIERDGIEVGRVVGDTTEYIDQPLTPNTSYDYSVTAQNENGQQSERVHFAPISTAIE